MSLVVTGASGHLGRLTVEALLERGVHPRDVVAAARTPERLGDLADRGVDVRRVDYSEPTTLKSAFDGAERVLLVSADELGARVALHRAVVDAARDAGVGLLAYTSIVRADTTPLLLAADHVATEQMILESGVPYVFLRNSWYLENYTAQIPTMLEHGAFRGCAGSGRLSAATRADYAGAAAAVLSSDGPTGQVYELGGDPAFTMTEYAAVLSELSGTEVRYVDQSPEEHQRFLESAGVPAAVAPILADADAGVARADLLVDTGDLGRLVGRPTTDLREAIGAALA